MVPEPQPRSQPRAFLWAAVGILGLASLLRIWGALGDLWLDEIWTIRIVERSGDAWSILYGRYVDNNHFLNSLYILLVGTDASPLALRSLSILTGTATVVVGGVFALRQGRAAALVTMLLFAISYPLVHYGSEARGYGPLVLFLAAAAYLVDTALERPAGWRLGLGLAVVLISGFMSQILFLYPVVGFVIWAVVGFQRSDRSLFSTVVQTTRLFSWSVLLLGGFVLSLMINWRTKGISVGSSVSVPGRGPWDLLDFFGSILQYFLGVPKRFPGAWVAVAVLILTGTLCWLAREPANEVSRRRAPLYWFHLILIPALLFATENYGVRIIRYLLPFGVVYLMLLGDILGNLLAGRGSRRSLAVLVLALFALGNGYQLVRFLDEGRGAYSDTLNRIVKEAGPGPVMITSYHRFRDPAVIQYYVEKEPELARIRYIDLEVGASRPHLHEPFAAITDLSPTEMPEWALQHGGFAEGYDDWIPCPTVVLKTVGAVSAFDEPDPNRPGCPDVWQVEVDGLDLQYELIHLAPHWGLSGWDWAVYRRPSDGANRDAHSGGFADLSSER